MRSKKSPHIKFVLIGVLAAVSYQAYGRLSHTDALSREWQMPLERNLSELSQSGDTGRLDLKNIPWSDAPWSGATGSILNRYKREDLPADERAKKRGLSLSELQRLPKNRLAREIELQSPAEIFDLVRGFTLYPLANEIRQLIGSMTTAALDEKMNFGWAAAATMMHEPKALNEKTLRIPPNLKADVTIGSSDVKGLISFYYGAKVPNLVKIAKVGARCHGERDLGCKRLDSASFHILLANMIKNDGKSFVIDVDPSSAVDYRPIAAYTTDIRKNENTDSSRSFTVTTSVETVRRRAPQIEPYGFYNLDTDKFEYKYTLEVDAKGNIIRGDWVSSARPEFAWRVLSLPHVDHEGFSALKGLYEEAPLIQLTEN